jgi:hypothetical protein
MENKIKCKNNNVLDINIDIKKQHKKEYNIFYRKKNKAPSYYTFNCKNGQVTVNDLLNCIARSFNDKSEVLVNLMEWTYYTNAVEYLLRAFRKGQCISDFKKTIHNLEFLLNEMEK